MLRCNKFKRIGAHSHVDGQSTTPGKTSWPAGATKRKSVKHGVRNRGIWPHFGPRSARGIVDAIYDAVTSFRGTAPQTDDMTAVAVKLTA